MADLNEVQVALTYIDANDRDTWLKVGTALKAEFGEQGYELFEEWSRTSPKFNLNAVKSTWKSARVQSCNIGYVFNRAKENGFVRQNIKPMSAAEIEERNRKNRERAAKEEQERAKKQANASRKAKWVWENRTKSANPKHPYLVKKGISDPAVLQHIRQSGDNLIIPLKQGKEVVGMEMIFPNGGKHFPADTPKKGSALFLGDTHLENLKQGFFVAEGFATAASIVQATGRPCLMTIDAGNMPTVVQSLKNVVQKHHIPVVLCADNDEDHKGEKKAKEAAEILGDTAQVIMPDFTAEEIARFQANDPDKLPSDFNDLQTLRGIDSVTKMLSGSLTAVVNPENKLLINVYGSPATGKSYTAEHLVAVLRDAGIECELVTEYATELIHQGKIDELKDQVVVTGEQLRREQAALNHANIVITDSPTALGIIYAPEHQKAALHDIAAQSDKIPHINILLRHDYESLATFSMNGRIHDKEQSLAIQEQLIELLKGKERIHHQRATPFEELINHIGTNQEWQRFAEHHNINLPRFDIAMDGTVLGRQPETFSGSLNVAENDTLTAEKTAESITMNDLKPIQARSYDNDPIRKAIQDIVIDDIKANFALYQQEYRQHPESFGGRYICSDLFKETIPFYNTDRETRSLFNGLVHNSAAVLADKQFYDALREIRQENDSKGKVAVFLTGSPGAGKTSSVQQGMVDEPNTALIYEGQLIRPESAIDKIQAALDSGLKVKILAVQNTPETALDNTIKRFEKLGRGSSIEVMAQIMGKTADGLDKLHQHFGDRIELEIHERHENDPLPPQYGWDHLDILRKYGDYEKIRQYLGQVLEQSRETGTYSENALHQANGRVGRVEQKHKLSLTSALLAYETRPRVLGDSRKQSLLSALETLTPSQTQPERTNDDEMPRPERAEWEKDFPKAVTNDLKGNLIDLPNYKDAKSGDLVAALDLVQNALTNDTVAQIKRNFAIDKDTLIVPVSALEQAGNNPIPNALARMLADRLGLEVHTDIVQATRVARTRKSADYRLIFQPAFTGEVLPNRNYLIVDDTLIQGGTVASLRGYINNRGGKVIGVAVLSAKEHSLQLAPTPEILHNINHKFGEELNEYWQKEFNYGINQLTNSEAVVLSKGNDLVSIRNRIAQEILSASGQVFPTGNTAAEIIPKELVAVIREIKGNNPNNVLRLETPKDVSNGRVFYETENFVIQQVADNSRYFQAWHKQDLNVPLQVGDKAKIYVDRNGQTQAKITDTSQERFRQTENTHGNGVGRTQKGYVESGGMVGQTTIAEQSEDLQSTQVIQDEPLNPTDEIPRPPQGGFVLPAINQSDENRQPETQNQTKENQMAEINNDDKQMLMQMLDENRAVSFRQTAAASELADDEVLRKAYQDNDESVRLAAVRNPNASAELLQEWYPNATGDIQTDIIVLHDNVNAETLKYAVQNHNCDDSIHIAIYQHPNANEEVFKELKQHSPVLIVQTKVDEILREKYGWDEERFAAFEQQQNAPKPENNQEWQPENAEFDNPNFEPEQPNGVWYGDSDEIITAEELNKPQPIMQSPADKAKAVFRELQNNYQGYGEYNRQTGIMYLQDTPYQEMLHYDPSEERIVLSGVNPENNQREEIADTHLKDLSPTEIAICVDKDRQAYLQNISQTQNFPQADDKQQIDQSGDKVEEIIRTAKQKTAQLLPPEAPPAALGERYTAVKRQFMDNATHYGDRTNLGVKTRVDYVDSENGKTVLFSDKGSKLTTAKNDAQTVADMIEVAKAKGWTSLKLSGNREFKRQAWLAAESQGIKVKGYSPSPEDKAMLEAWREKRSLNGMEEKPAKQEKNPERQPENTPQAEKQADKTPQKDLSGSPKQPTKQDTADKLKGGILLAHGKAPYQFKENGNESYFATIQKANGEEKTYWGVDIERAIQESGIDDGDRISLKKVGQETVRVQEEVKDEHGKTVLDDDGNPLTEEVMRERMKWQAELYEKAKEVPQAQGKQEDLPQEKLIKHDLIGQPEKQSSTFDTKADYDARITQGLAHAESQRVRNMSIGRIGRVDDEIMPMTDKLDTLGNNAVKNVGSQRIRQNLNGHNPQKTPLTMGERLSNAKQRFHQTIGRLPENSPDRIKAMAYAQNIQDDMHRYSKDEERQKGLAANMFHGLSNAIETGEISKYPPAMSNNAARSALENRQLERSNQEVEIER